MGMHNDMRPCSSCGANRNAESMDCTDGVWTCAACFHLSDESTQKIFDDAMAPFQPGYDHGYFGVRKVKT
ncbi:hypothetical protein RA2_04093 [Roseovarius sp. A-2]|nr:hypothetical protein RA2_04093 [Roseovarius sp. A-2]